MRPRTYLGGMRSSPKARAAWRKRMKLRDIERKDRIARGLPVKRTEQTPREPKPAS